MTENEVALAANYVHIRNQLKHILNDLDGELEISPHSICDMFSWKECCNALRPLVENKLAEFSAKLEELGVNV